MQDEVGVIGRADRGEIEFLRGNVTLVPAPFDVGSGWASTSSRVPWFMSAPSSVLASICDRRSPAGRSGRANSRSLNRRRSLHRVESDVAEKVEERSRWWGERGDGPGHHCERLDQTWLDQWGHCHRSVRAERKGAQRHCGDS